jgi:hypothetical protein
MNTKLSKTFSTAFLFALVSPFTLAGNSGADLSMRPAIYVTSSKTTIDLKNDKYVAAGGTITLKKSQSVGCEENKCTFHLGIIAFKSGGPSTLSTYGLFKVPTVIYVGNTIFFANTESTKQQVLPVKLAIGKNTVIFTIDPDNKIVETNETNNSFTVTIVVDGMS